MSNLFMYTGCSDLKNLSFATKFSKYVARYNIITLQYHKYQKRNILLGQKLKM